MRVLPDVVGPGRRLAGVGAALAVATALAGCSQFDAALGQRQAIVSFHAGTPLSQRLAVRSACGKAPAVTAHPPPSDLSSPYALHQLTFQVTHTTHPDATQLQHGVP